jgi:hypothetical protein
MIIPSLDINTILMAGEYKFVKGDLINKEKNRVTTKLVGLTNTYQI